MILVFKNMFTGYFEPGYYEYVGSNDVEPRKYSGMFASFPIGVRRMITL